MENGNSRITFSCSINRKITEKSDIVTIHWYELGHSETTTLES